MLEKVAVLPFDFGSLTTAAAAREAAGRAGLHQEIMDAVLAKAIHGGTIKVTYVPDAEMREPLDGLPPGYAAKPDAPEPLDYSPEVWINRCPINHHRDAVCPRCEPTRPPGAKHGQPVQS